VHTSALAMPKGFGTPQREAWDDLIESTDPKLQVKENRFTFEIAATLLAKFRSGRAMTATESKELKRQMVVLGLAKDDDAPGPRKPRKNAGYFDQQ
jgi:hypothetical protein